MPWCLGEIKHMESFQRHVVVHLQVSARNKAIENTKTKNKLRNLLYKAARISCNESSQNLPRCWATALAPGWASIRCDSTGLPIRRRLLDLFITKCRRGACESRH